MSMPGCDDSCVMPSAEELHRNENRELRRFVTHHTVAMVFSALVVVAAAWHVVHTLRVTLVKIEQVENWVKEKHTLFEERLELYQQERQQWQKTIELRLERLEQK